MVLQYAYNISHNLILQTKISLYNMWLNYDLRRQKKIENLFSTVERSGSNKNCAENRISILLEILKLWNYFYLASEWQAENWSHQMSRAEKLFFRRKRISVILTWDPSWLLSKNLAKLWWKSFNLENFT